MIQPRLLIKIILNFRILKFYSEEGFKKDGRTLDRLHELMPPIVHDLFRTAPSWLEIRTAAGLFNSK
jgi:hypothetical protein